MPPKDYNEKLWPLVIAVVLCAVFIAFINMWAQRQIKTIEKAHSAIKEEPKGRAAAPAKQVEPAAEEDWGQTPAPQADKLQEMVDAQYEVYSQESEKERASPSSRYNIYPSKEDLQKIREKKLLMY